MAIHTNYKNSSYFGITDFSSISNSSSTTNRYASIYRSGSEKTQLNSLTAALTTLKSARAAATTEDEKNAVTAQITKITTAMKNSFKTTDSEATWAATDSRSIREQASANADALLKKLANGSTIDELL